jgi:hypothetical protein
MYARGKKEKQEQQQGQPAVASDNTLLSAGDNWKCSLCDKVFDSLYILNYHNMLEHGTHKRPPIGVA